MNNTYTWTKSTRSQTDWQRQCVEIGAPPTGRGRAIRDSVNPQQARLEIGAGPLATLLGTIRTTTR